MAFTPETDRALGDPVLARSIEVLKAGQSPSGALVASPDFGVYRFAWLRDGAFCAHALDVAREHDAAWAWHEWVFRSVEAHRALLESVIQRIANGDTPAPEEMPPARYTLDGALETESGDIEAWPNFQIDGYGMWLWALECHLEDRPLPAEHVATVDLVARYLDRCGLLECWDCWEEWSGGRHASTLASVFAGLRAAATLLGDAWSEPARRIRQVLLDDYLVDGRFRKGPGDDRVDASLLWLSVPYDVLPREDPRILATIEAVRRDLAGPGGGIYRYLGDTYFGGGQWLLLTSWLAWHDALAGSTDLAAAGQGWVRAQALANGDLPEQVCGHSQDLSMVEPWIERWGTVATPLLWSHAMYLISERART